MSYQVIARKYRPQKFSEVIGQEHVTQTLANAIQQNRIAHAYLFVGPRGTGKTTIARIFAKCLNCTGGPKANPPDDDPKCREITEGRSLDVLEIDGASNRGIDEIRELRDTVRYAPASSKYKIYIIDEVHMLTKEAFNALLKTLEEPPEHVKFMFATTEPEKVLPTILSRCQRFDLRRIPTLLIVKHLGEIAAKEGVQIEEGALYAIARAAEGGMRDAESTLDQLISFCGTQIQESDVLAVFGLAGREQLVSLANSIIGSDPAQALQILNDLARGGKDLGRLVSDLLAHFRNLMIYQLTQGGNGLLEVPEREVAALAQQSATLAPHQVTQIMEVLTEAEGRLRDAASKKIFIEVTLLKAIEARNAVSLDSVLKTLQQLRSSGEDPGTAPAAAPAPAATSSPSAASGRVKSSSAAAEGEPSPKASIAAPSVAPVAVATATAASGHAPSPAVEGELGPLWIKLLEALRSSRFIRAYLQEAHPVAVNRNQLTIGFDPGKAESLGLVDNAQNRGLIESKLQEIGYKNLSVRFVAAPPPAGWNSQPPAVAPEEARPPAGPARSAKAEPGDAVPRNSPTVLAKDFSSEDFKNDPLIKKALEIFKGTIVEVRTSA